MPGPPGQGGPARFKEQQGSGVQGAVSRGGEQEEEVREGPVGCQP